MKSRRLSFSLFLFCILALLLLAPSIYAANELCSDLLKDGVPERLIKEVQMRESSLRRQEAHYEFSKRSYEELKQKKAMIEEKLSTFELHWPWLAKKLGGDKDNINRLRVFKYAINDLEIYLSGDRREESETKRQILKSIDDYFYKNNKIYAAISDRKEELTQLKELNEEESAELDELSLRIDEFLCEVRASCNKHESLLRDVH